jgi:hypothetical protein
MIARMTSNRARLMVALTVLSVAAAILLPAVPQPSAYHDFADTRAGLGIENVLDVVSNAGFLLAGLAGLAIVMRRATRFQYTAERWPYGIFFLGLVLTAAGSAWYHLAPDNERLFWDRLPITLALMSLLAAQIVDRINVRAGLRLLVPLLLAGAASAVYWIATERAGVGNVVPYVILQGYAIVMVVVIAWSYPSRYSHGGDIYRVFALYAAAKVLELLDREVLALGGIVGGHTLKHLVAAVAGILVCRMLLLRRPLV